MNEKEEGRTQYKAVLLLLDDLGSDSVVGWNRLALELKVW